MEIIYVNCGLKMDVKGIFAVMNTTYAVVKTLSEKIQTWMAFEPVTSAILVQCSDNFAFTSA